MMPFLSDWNSLPEMFGNIFGLGMGGDWIFLAMALFMFVFVIMFKGNVKASGLSMMFLGFSYFFAIYEPMFKSFVYLAIVGMGIVFVLAIKDRFMR